MALVKSKASVFVPSATQTAVAPRYKALPRTPYLTPPYSPLPPPPPAPPAPSSPPPRPSPPVIIEQPTSPPSPPPSTPPPPQLIDRTKPPSPGGVYVPPASEVAVSTPDPLKEQRDRKRVEFTQKYGRPPTEGELNLFMQVITGPSTGTSPATIPSNTDLNRSRFITKYGREPSPQELYNFSVYGNKDGTVQPPPIVPDTPVVGTGAPGSGVDIRPPFGGANMPPGGPPTYPTPPETPQPEPPKFPDVKVPDSEGVPPENPYLNIPRTQLPTPGNPYLTIPRTQPPPEVGVSPPPSDLPPKGSPPPPPKKDEMLGGVLRSFGEAQGWIWDGNKWILPGTETPPPPSGGMLPEPPAPVVDFEDELYKATSRFGLSQAEIDELRYAYGTGNTTRVNSLLSQFERRLALTTDRNRRYSDITRQLMEDPLGPVDINALYFEDPELAKMVLNFYNNDPAFRKLYEHLLKQHPPTRPEEGPANMSPEVGEPTDGLPPEEEEVAPLGKFDLFFNMVDALGRGEALDLAAFNALDVESQEALRKHSNFRLTQPGEEGGNTGTPPPGEPDIDVHPEISPEQQAANEKAEEERKGAPPGDTGRKPEDQQKIDAAKAIFDAAPEGEKFDAWFKALDILFPPDPSTPPNPVKTGAEEFEALPPEQKRSLQASVEKAIQQTIDILGFDPSIERQNRISIIDRNYEDARVRLGRQFGIDPGGEKSGRAQVAFESLEMQRANELNQLEVEISQRVIEVRQKNLELLTDSLSQIGGLALEGGKLSLEGEKLKETVRQFDASLRQRIKEFGDTFGLDEAKTEALIDQIYADITNSTRGLSATIGQTWAEITGTTGTPAPITVADLGVNLSNLKTNPLYALPGMRAASPEASAVKASFNAMFGRAPTTTELNTLLDDKSITVDGAPTLEARKVGSLIAEQQMERAYKYDAIADQHQLDRDKFEQAKTESDKEWSLTTLDVAPQFGLDPDKFRIAKFEADRDILSGKDPQTALAEAASRNGLPLASFVGASNLFDALYGDKQRATAQKFDFDAKTFLRASSQADEQETKIVTAWQGLLNIRAPKKESDVVLFARSPTLYYATEAIFKKIIPSPFRAQIPQEVKDNPAAYVDDILANPENAAAVKGVKDAAEISFGQMSDEQVRQYLINVVSTGRMTLETKLDISYLDPNWLGSLKPEHLHVLMNMIGAGFTPERENQGGSAWETFLISMGQIATALAANPRGPFTGSGGERSDVATLDLGAEPQEP